MVSISPPPKGRGPRSRPPNLAPTQEDMVAFLKACENGDVMDMEWFGKYFPGRTVHRAGKTGLMYAAEHGQGDAAQALLKMGYDVNAAAEDGMTALLYAVRGNKDSTVRLLLEKGAEPLAIDDSGGTALHLAAFHGSTEALETLLPVSLPALNKETNGGHERAVRLLLDKGAMLDARVGGQSLIEIAEQLKFDAIAQMLKNEPARRREHIDNAFAGGAAEKITIRAPFKLLAEKKEKKEAKKEYRKPGGTATRTFTSASRDYFVPAPAQVALKSPRP